MVVSVSARSFFNSYRVVLVRAIRVMIVAVVVAVVMSVSQWCIASGGELVR